MATPSGGRRYRRHVARRTESSLSVTRADRRRNGVQLGQVALGQVDAGRHGVLVQVTALLRARDRDDVLALGERPGDGDLGRGRAEPVGHRTHDVDDAQVVLQDAFLEPRHPAAQVVVLKARLRDRAGEEPPAERRERHERRAVGGAPADDVSGALPARGAERVARPQRQLGLDRGDGVHAVRLLGLGDADLRQAQMADLALADQLRHGAPRLGERDLRVDAVQVVQVDHVGVEPAQAGLDRLAYVAGRPVAYDLTGAGIGDQADLAAEHGTVAYAVQGLAHELLVVPRAVDVAGVQERHAQVDGLPDQRHRLAVVTLGLGVGPAHAHAAETDRAHPAIPELPHD